MSLQRFGYKRAAASSLGGPSCMPHSQHGSWTLPERVIYRKDHLRRTKVIYSELTRARQS